jgi:hypothetical protein
MARVRLANVTAGEAWQVVLHCCDCTAALMLSNWQVHMLDYIRTADAGGYMGVLTACIAEPVNLLRVDASLARSPFNAATSEHDCHIRVNVKDTSLAPGTCASLAGPLRGALVIPDLCTDLLNSSDALLVSVSLQR